MAYSVDLAYVDYFKCAAEGKYDRTPIKDRLTVSAVSSATTLSGIVRLPGRLVSQIYELAKVIFYSLASVFTLGFFGNGKRLGDHCKLFFLNLGGIATQSIQLTVHSLAILMGIVSPKAAYRMMQVGSTPHAWITSQEQKVWQNYKTPEVYDKVVTALTVKVSKIFEKFSFAIELSMKTIMTEFSSALDAALVAPLGYMSRFHIFGANPKLLTDEQRKMVPILLLNGNYSHQGTWLPLLHALKKSGNKRPVYTFNLPPNCCKLKDTLPKIEEIKKLHGNSDEFEIDVIGHSMGSSAIQELALQIALNNWESENGYEKLNITKLRSMKNLLRKVITIGHTWEDKVQLAKWYVDKTDNKISSIERRRACKDIYDITGKRDILNSDKSELDVDRKKEIDTGHLGLLSHPVTLQTIQDFLA